jgi:hypothetical protein
MIKIKLIAISATIFGILVFGVYVGKGIESRSAQLKIIEAKDNLYSCRETVMTMNQMATNMIVDQQLKINQEAKNADAKIKELESTVDNAVSIAERLRNEARKAESRYRACQSTSTPSATGEEAGPMLTDLYARIDEAAGVIAEYADRTEIAHLACVNSVR